MTDLQKKLARLSPAQKAAFLKKLAAKKAKAKVESNPALSIPVRLQDQSVPMTSSQQRLWFLQRYTEGGSLYNMPIALRLQGKLDPLAMEKAIAAVINRHKILSTCFYQTEQGAYQKQCSAGTFKLLVDDLTNIDDSNIRLHDLLQKMAGYPFDLEQESLIQIRLIKLAKNDYVLATCAHHIITDGWSVNVFMRDFSAFYQAELNDSPAVLPELPIQFADYAVWQQQTLNSTDGEKSLAFWRGYLKGVPYFLDLPIDFKRPEKARNKGALFEFTIEQACKQSLLDLARAQQVSVFVLLLTAFAVLLARFSVQKKILIGSPFAGRNYKELEDLIGFFVNSLPIKVECSGKESFVELLQQTQGSFLDVNAHQQVPFEKIVEMVQPDRSETFSPLFQVMFTYLNDSTNANTLPGFSVQPIALDRTTAKFDLTLSIQEQALCLTGLVEYDTDLFESTSIETMMQGYVNILQSVVLKPERLIEEINLLSTKDYQKIVYDWNDCRTDFPRQQTIPQGVFRHVERWADHIAVEHGSRQLSYQQLNQQANQLAHRLIEQGVEAGDFVALYLQRGCDFVIAMLATLKAGGTYLPLDLAYPPERLVLMYQQTGVALTLTQLSLQQDAQKFGQTKVLLVDDDPGSSYSQQNPDRQGYADALAYVMFTSGSTGNPKGIGISHAAINRLVLNTNYIDLTPADRMAQTNNTAFDASTFEIWGALLNGARLVIADRELSLSVNDFSSFLHDQKISVLLLTTALLNQIVQYKADTFASLRCVLFGGEKVDPEQVKKVVKQGKPEHFLHIYGPTESATFASCYQIKSVSDNALTIPIGSTLTNTRLYILDTALNPVPVGVSGELYIAGEGLSPCYINQPMETALKYVPDVFARQAGERMYRSGDMVRWVQHGDIEFVGRVDHQVKVRGFRIELGAIEAAINNCTGVKQAYVKVAEQGGAGKRLLGYFSVEHKQSVELDTLWATLQTALPEYMLPVALIPLPDFPLTPNGKIDDKALPEPAAENYQQLLLTTPPETEDEIRLAGIWQQLLGVEAGKESDFFLLGGHSLLAMQLVNRIQTGFGVKLPIREVFVHSQLAKQALAIKNSTSRPELKLVAVEAQDSYPLSFSQQRLYFLQQLYPESTAYNMVSAIKLTGHIDADRLADCLQYIIQRHSVLRAVFVLENAQPRQIISEQSVEIVRLDWRNTDKQKQLDHTLKQELEFSFVLDQFPLIRVQLIQFDTQEFVLLVNNHHILSDGWSQMVFLQELMQLYQADPELSVLPELPIQYVDYAVWQRQYLSEEKLETLLTYWRGKLADMPPALNLHIDSVKQSEAGAIAASESFTLNAEITERIKALAAQTQCSVFTLLSAVFDLFLARYSGQHDIAIGTPVANRDHQETEKLIGFFVNTLVLRHKLEGNPSFVEFLAGFKQTVLDAFAHQSLPFEKLVEALQPERDLAGTPFFQVMFIYHQASDQVLTLSSLDSELLPLASPEAKFDLTLVMQESGGQLQATFEYNADLFKTVRIQEMSACFVYLLEQLLAQPEQPVTAVSILPIQQYQKIVLDWNQCVEPLPDDVCLHHLFERSAGQYPDHIALEQGGVSLTYQALNQQAEQLADILVAKGAKAEVMIGLCLNRTPRLIVAMLAIIKTGAAYVPLDSAYPSNRLENTLEDAEVLLLLTESELLAAHVSLNSIPYLLLDQPWATVDQQERSHLGSANLAYLLYTSGSTGRPKGVAITHASAVAMVQWAQQVYSAEQLSRVLAGTSVCFDLSVFEIFLTLSQGGTIVLLANVIELAEKTETEPSLINTVPSAAEELLRADAIPESVKTVNLAGEPLSTELVNKLYAKGHIEKVYDLYGPSEDTTYSTYTLRLANAIASIGRPISHTQAYVLDDYMQPLPVGVPGELYLAGMGLARGYHNRTALTAEKFVPNPFDEMGSRLYKTGDLVSYTDTGELLYRGRIDQQVKVRGFRIELGEVETVLASDVDVEECLVFTVGDAASSDRKLVAYIKSSATESFAELEDKLVAVAKQQLPKFMLPAAIVIMEQFPLTPNGKVDKKALPNPELKLETKAFVPAVGLVQKTLTVIWQEILALEHPISIHDDFFELGGHSLLVLDLMSQIKLALGKTVPLAAIFQAPTISGLSGLIDAEAQQAEWSPLVNIQPKGSQTPVFCIHPVGGQVLCYNALAKVLGDNQPVYGVRASGMEADQPIIKDLTKMATYYLEAIKAIHKQGSYRLVGYSFGGLVAYELASQLESQGETIEWVALLDTAHPELTKDNAAKTDDAELLVSLFPTIGYTADRLRGFSLSEQLKQVFDKAKQTGLVPRAMDDVSAERYFNVCRSNLLMDFQPKNIRSPIRLIRAQEGSQRISIDDFLGWQQLNGLNMTLHWVTGQHENMMEQPNIKQIARLLS